MFMGDSSYISSKEDLTLTYAIHDVTAKVHKNMQTAYNYMLIFLST